MTDSYSVFFQGLIEQWPINLALLAFIIGLFGLLLLNQNQRQKINDLQHKLQLIQNEMRALNSGALGIGKKIQNVQSELATTEQKVSVMPSQNKNSKIYEQATVLLERGATIEEVASCCEIPAAEVELLAVIQLSGKRNRRHTSAQMH